MSSILRMDLSRNATVARTFGARAASYEAHADLQRASLHGRRLQRFRLTLAGRARAGLDRRKLVGADDAELCLRLKNARGRNADIEVLPHGRRHQASQLIILEDLPPPLIAKRRHLGQ